MQYVSISCWTILMTITGTGLDFKTDSETHDLIVITHALTFFPRVPIVNFNLLDLFLKTNKECCV